MGLGDFPRLVDDVTWVGGDGVMLHDFRLTGRQFDGGAVVPSKEDAMRLAAEWVAGFVDSGHERIALTFTWPTGMVKVHMEVAEA